MRERNSLTFRLSPHRVVFYRGGTASKHLSPSLEFLLACPPGVKAKTLVRLKVIAAAPPWKFGGGGYWEAMNGAMFGWFELRIDGPGRGHFRFFCLLDHFAPGFDQPLLVVIACVRKPFRTVISPVIYREIRQWGEEYFAERAVE